MQSRDPFTLRRLVKFTEDFRARKGEFPVLPDLADEGFTKTLVQWAVKTKALEEVYVTLTSGATVKGYKPPAPFREK